MRNVDLFIMIQTLIFGFEFELLFLNKSSINKITEKYLAKAMKLLHVKT